MDFKHPVQAIFPGAQGRLLNALARSDGELHLRALARVAEVSPGQASRVLARLVGLGIVRRRDLPPIAMFSIAEKHVVGSFLRELSHLRETVTRQLAREARHIDPKPEAVILFGSVARGEAGPASDLDVLIVRSDEVAIGDDSWADAIFSWTEFARDLTGNQVAVLELSLGEVQSLVWEDSGLWAEVQRDGIVLLGQPLIDLRNRLANAAS